MFLSLLRRFSRCFVAEKKKAKERTPGAGTSATTSLDPDIPSSTTTTSSPSWLQLFLFLPFAHPSRETPTAYPIGVGFSTRMPPPSRIRTAMGAVRPPSLREHIENYVQEFDSFYDYFF